MYHEKRQEFKSLTIQSLITKSAILKFGKFLTPKTPATTIAYQVIRLLVCRCLASLKKNVNDHRFSLITMELK